MVRGTTAQFRFKLPCKADEVITAQITFWQPGNEGFGKSIQKDLTNCVVATDDDYCLCVSLDHKETLRFSDKVKAKVQLKAQYGNTIFASRQQSITVYPINDAIAEGEDPLPYKDGWVIFDGKEITM